MIGAHDELCDDRLLRREQLRRRVVAYCRARARIGRPKDAPTRVRFIRRAFTRLVLVRVTLR